MLKKILIAAFLAFLLVQVNWEELKGVTFEDKENTIAVMRIDREYDLFSLSDAISNETLWNIGFLYLVHNNNMDIDVIFKNVSFLCVFVFVLLVLVEGHYLLFFFLINPLIIDFCFSQYRSALAMALLYLAYMLRKRRIYLPILILLPAVFIHTSVLLILLIYFLIFILLKKFRSQKKKLIFFSCLIALVICIILGPFRDIILTYFNDRRADIKYPHSSGLLFSIFWIILAVYFLIQRKNFYNNELLLTGIVLLFIYLINTLVLNIYGSRFLSIGFVIFLVAISKFKGAHLKIIIPLFVLNSLIQWIYWL
jgi:hypothetical protein